MKNLKTNIWVGLSVLIITLAISPSAFAKKKKDKWVETSDHLKYLDVKKGDKKGDVAKQGDTITVNYTGTLENGTEFDSSEKPGRTPLSFKLGVGQVIKGWDEGVEGMKTGGERKLIIPADLAYGANPPPGSNIPSNATLLFTVKLISVKHDG